MPTPLKFRAAFTPGQFYHLVSKSIDGLLLFHEKDFELFMDRFKHFTAGFLDVLAYSLQSNHAHYIVRAKEKKEVASYINDIPSEKKTKAIIEFTECQDNNAIFNLMFERQVNRFLVSYAYYYGAKYNRKGGIFQKPFKRMEINDESYLQQAIIYVNANAQKHKLVNDFKTWPWNAYTACINSDPSYVNIEQVLKFFGSRQQFIDAHTAQVANYYSNAWPNSKLE